MTSDDIQDFKQFIETTMSQQLALQTADLKSDLKKEITEEITKEFRKELRKEITASEERLSAQIRELSESVGEALDTSNSENQRQLDNHEQRITKLEQQPATA